ncbi:MAG: hypothetical protein ABL925_06005 [Methylococcales bacterium]
MNIQVKQQPRLRVMVMLTAQLALAGGLDLAVTGIVSAAEAEFVEAPIQFKSVYEYDLPGNLIQQDNALTSFPLDQGPSAKIDLGPEAGAPHSTSLGPTFAEAYSTFNGQTQTSTFWAAVNDYPGSPYASSPYNSGVSQAEVVQTWHMQKQHNDDTVTLHVTGGRLQLVDYAGREPLAATVRLEWYVRTNSANISDGQYVAALTGHGGTLGGSETFNYTSQGFQISSYTEQSGYGSLNTVGATLDIPAQEIDVDISSIFANNNTTTTGEFFIEVTLSAEALALYGDGGAAMAFLRDPTSGGQPDPTLGGVGLSFSGVKLLAPVPLPASWIFFLAGSGLFAGVSRNARMRNPLAVTAKSIDN